MDARKAPEITTVGPVKTWSQFRPRSNKKIRYREEHSAPVVLS